MLPSICYTMCRSTGTFYCHQHLRMDIPLSSLHPRLYWDVESRRIDGKMLESVPTLVRWCLSIFNLKLVRWCSGGVQLQADILVSCRCRTRCPPPANLKHLHHRHAYLQRLTIKLCSQSPDAEKGENCYRAI